MAIHWHWAFGNESAANLQSNAGFTFNNTYAPWAAPVGGPSDVYSYAGSPQRYSWFFGTNGMKVTIPSVAVFDVLDGWVSVPFKSGGHVLNWQPIIYINESSYPIYVLISNAVGFTATLSLYVNNIFKSTTLTPFDFSSWHYVALKFDMSTTTHSAELWVDGVLELGPQTHFVGAAATFVTTSFTSGSYYWIIGQIIVYDDTADAGHVPRFVTRVEPNADGTNTGTWTPSTGSDDYAVVDSPLDVTTYTEDGAPVIGNRLEVLTNGGGSNLAAALGVTPPNIDSVLHHNYSDGVTVDVQAKVGDGTSETAGATVAIFSSGTRYAYALANTRPSGGAWTGTDAPTLVYEIV